MSHPSADDAAPGRQEEGDAVGPRRGPWSRAPENPWWIPPVLGRAPQLPAERISMVGAISLAILFENFDNALLTAAAKQIAASFALSESDLAGLFQWIHFGAVIAVVLIPLADQLGRRRVFLASVIGLSVATALSSLAQSATQFVLLQMFGRACMIANAATAYTILTEELPADHRGWGIGILGSIGSVGYGIGLLSFGVVDLAYGSWRLLYAAGVLPLLLLPWLRARVRETERFAARGEAPALRETMGELWRPLAALFVRYPARSLGIGAVAALASASQSSALQYSAYFVQSVHGWQPWQYAVMAFFAGGVGILGNAWAGRAADARGRRVVGFAVLLSFPLCAFAFFRGPELLVPAAWIALVFSLTGTSTIERALGAELFPTDLRGTASGWVLLAESIGRFAGFGVVGWLTPAGASVVPALLWISLAAAAGACVVLLLPETRQRELEDISA